MYLHIHEDMERQVDRVVEENVLPLHGKQWDEEFLILVYRYYMSRTKKNRECYELEEICQQTFARIRNNRNNITTRGSNLV